MQRKPILATDAAVELLNAATSLGAIITRVEELTRLDPLIFKDEEEAADMVVIQGEEVMSSLRRLAMRLDRAAYFAYCEAK